MAGALRRGGQAIVSSDAVTENHEGDMVQRLGMER